MKFIDCHTHAFPTGAMGRAWQTLAGIPEGKRSGSIAELTDLIEKGGLDGAVTLLFARSGEHLDQLLDAGRSREDARAEVRQESRDFNRWGCELASRDGRFIPFIGINVRFMDAQEAVAEIDALAAAGAKGVKLIPPAMKLYGNDPLLMPVYEACARLGLPVLSQSGARPGSSEQWGRPRYFADALATFPRLMLILAHLGHGHEEEVVSLAHTYPNVYTDTSLQLSGLGKPGRPTPAELVDTMRRIGCDRVLFGSNFPFTNPAAYKSILSELPLTESEREMIAAGNLERLLAARLRT